MPQPVCALASRLRREGGAAAVVGVQRPLVAHAAGRHVRLHRTGVKGHGIHAEQLLVALATAIQLPQQQVQRAAEIISRGGDGAAAAHLAQQVKEDVGRVHHQLLLQGGHDAAPQIALFVRGVVQVVRHDDGAVPTQGAPQQIVRRNMIIVARLHHKRKPRLADAVFIVAQQRLGNAQLRRRLALGDAPLLPQQAQRAGKISCHLVFHPLIFLYRK